MIAYVVLEMNRNTHLYNGRGGVSYTVQQRSDGDVAKLNRTYQGVFLPPDTSYEPISLSTLYW